jgi:hypothetical protein
VALAREDYEEATELLREGVALSGQTGDQANLAYSLKGLATVTGVRGEAERSARLFGAAERLLEEVGIAVYNYYKPDRSLYERTEAAVRSELGGLRGGEGTGQDDGLRGGHGLRPGRRGHPPPRGVLERFAKASGPVPVTRETTLSRRRAHGAPLLENSPET